MESNTWYYTLSTISQTLAAILALAAVFAILRLESLKKNIDNYKRRALMLLNVKEKIFKFQQKILEHNKKYFG